MINNDLLVELFKHYTENEKKQLEQQIDIMMDYISKNAELYNGSKSFSKAIDDVLKLILSGNFIQKENTDETL